MKTYIGVDIGGTSLKVGFVSPEGKIFHHYSFPFNKGGEPQEETIRRLGRSILGDLRKAGVESSSVVGIGVGCPGSINSKEGVCCYNGNLLWRDLPIAALLKETTGFNTKVSNDANVAMLGEARFGAAKEYHNAVLLTLGTGVGGGLYLDDHLYEGNEGKGAEVGHMIIEYHGYPCTCGLEGCLESYASVTGLIRMTKDKMHEHPESKMWEYCDRDLGKVNGKTAFESAKLGDKAALEVVDTYENYLTVGLINFANIFRPEAFLIGGGLSNQKEYLTDALEKKLKAAHYGFRGTPAVKVVTASLGNDAGILGAAALWMN